MAPEDLKLSAEMCGHSAECILPCGVYLVSNPAVLWEPHKNPAQWQDCILKLLELNYEVVFHSQICEIAEEDKPWSMFDVEDGSPLEFPVLALAELKRRMK